MNGRARQIVGIAPPGFTDTRRELDDDASQVWLALSAPELARLGDQRRVGDVRPEGDLPVGLLARIRDDVSDSAATAEVAGILAGVPGASGAGPDDRIRVAPHRGPDGSALELVAFMAVPFIVLALACVNAAHLLTARIMRRLRDSAVRLAIGASPWRVVRATLVESLLLALAAAGIGLAFSHWIVAAVEARFPLDLTINWRVTTFAVLTACLTTLAFGLAPAVASTSRAMSLVRGMSSRPGTRTRRILIGTQAALSLGLMLTGWQFINTVRTMAASDGLRAAERLMVISIDVSGLDWQPADAAGYYERVEDRLRQVPGVTHVSTSCACDPWAAWNSRSGGSLRVRVPGPDGMAIRPTLAMYAGGDLFGAIELSIIRGRGFEAADERAPARAIVINRPFAELLGGDPIGRVLEIAAAGDDGATSHTVTVVGVVEPPAVKRTDSLPMVYYPVPLAPLPARTLYVRFDDGAASKMALVRSALREINAEVPRPAIATAVQRRWERNTERQFLAGGVSFLGILALLLSAGGLYGVVASAVNLRSREIALRMALRAGPERVVRLIVRQALTPAVAGAAAGILSAIALGLVVRARLYGSSPVDLLALSGATTVLFLVLSLASVLPARRAARLNPIELLRSE